MKQSINTFIVFLVVFWISKAICDRLGDAAKRAIDRSATSSIYPTASTHPTP